MTPESRNIDNEFCGLSRLPRFVSIIGLIVVGILLLFTACGTEPPVADDPTTTVAVAPPPVPTFVTVELPAVTTEPAVANMPAVRVDPPETTSPPPPDPCTLEQYVNELPYRWMDKGPTGIAYPIVAACLGWTPATIEFYRAGILDDIFPGESGHCPDNSGGSFVDENCRVYKRGTGDDTGLFQITRAGWGTNGVLCRDHGYCSAMSIRGTPWHSMRAGLILIMRSGKFPWTWDRWACSYHSLVCNTWPKAWSNL
jgi:hypothetical protein